MRTTPSLSLTRLKQVLTYDPESGVFTWAIGRKHVVAGTAAGSPEPAGRIVITVDRRGYFAHRLAWFYMTGKWPSDEVDHINRNQADNSWRNLRSATRSENACNRGRQSNNRSGFTGVAFHRPTGRYQAYVVKHGRQIHLGRFDTAEAAARARQQAVRQWHQEFTVGAA